MGLFAVGTAVLKPGDLRERMMLGSACGAVAACFGTPTEVALVRMAADARAPPAQRRNYRGVAHALASVAREGGVAALWSGVGPTVLRAALLNAGQLGIYSEVLQAAPHPTVPNG